MSNQIRKRKLYLDIAKGIGIILVVLGHCPQVYNPVKQWIYAFHMPLFFIISGMVWDKGAHDHRGYFNKAFVFDKIKRLIIPCYIWGIVYMILNALLNRSFSPVYIAYLIYGSQSGFSHAGSLSSLWFLPCMFLAVCVFEVIQMVNKRDSKAVLVLVSIICAAISFLLPHISGGYPWSFDVVFLAVAFMIWGYLGQGLIKKTDSKVILSAITVIAIAVLTLTYRLNLPFVNINNTDLAGRYFGKPTLYLFDALSGSIGVIIGAILIRDSRYIGNGLAFLGKRTIPIFIIHKPVVQIINRIGSSVQIRPVFIVLCSVVVGLGASLVVYELVRRVLPVAFGEKHSCF